MFQYAVIQLLFSLRIVKINKVYVFPAVLQGKLLMKRLLLLESLSTLIFGLQIRRDEGEAVPSLPVYRSSLLGKKYFT